jgi:hypothetical protein
VKDDYEFVRLVEQRESYRAEAFKYWKKEISIPCRPSGTTAG